LTVQLVLLVLLDRQVPLACRVPMALTASLVQLAPLEQLVVRVQSD
jgi:hypothetical protein